MQALDLLAFDAGLEGKIELGQRLHGGQARGAHGGLQAAVVAQHDLGLQQLLDGLAGGGAAVVGLREDIVDGLEGAGHLEVGEHRPHAVAPAHRGGRHRTAAVYSRSGRRCTGTAGRGRGAGAGAAPRRQ